MTATGFYFEDVVVGSEYLSTGRTVSELDLSMFTVLSADWHPIHADAVHAANTQFGQRILQGPFGIAIALGLFGQFHAFTNAAIALTEIAEWRFLAPIFVGDTLRLRMRIAGKKLSASGRRGLLDRHMTLWKQDGSTAQEGRMGLLMACRPDPDPAVFPEGGPPVGGSADPK